MGTFTVCEQLPIRNIKTTIVANVIHLLILSPLHISTTNLSTLRATMRDSQTYTIYATDRYFMHKICATYSFWSIFAVDFPRSTPKTIANKIGIHPAISSAVLGYPP